MEYVLTRPLLQGKVPRQRGQGALAHQWRPAMGSRSLEGQAGVLGSSSWCPEVPGGFPQWEGVWAARPAALALPVLGQKQGWGGTLSAGKTTGVDPKEEV